jgi:hypothetical protein
MQPPEIPISVLINSTFAFFLCQYEAGFTVEQTFGLAFEIQLSEPYLCTEGVYMLFVVTFIGQLIFHTKKMLFMR